MMVTQRLGDKAAWHIMFVGDEGGGHNTKARHRRIIFLTHFLAFHFTAGHIPLLKNGVLMTGKVGADKSLEEGQEAAQVIAINLLATLKSELGDLDKVGEDALFCSFFPL